MGRYRGKSSFHRNLGHDLYTIIYCSLFFLCIKIWGANVILSSWLVLLWPISYFLVGFILRKIGVWKY